MARAQMLYDNKKFVFGSLQEAIAIEVFNNQRDVDFLKPLLTVADPDKFSNLFRKFRGKVYPELRFDDLRYIQKSRNLFKKLRGINMRVHV